MLSFLPGTQEDKGLLFGGRTSLKNMCLPIFCQRGYTWVIAGVSIPAGVCAFLHEGRQLPQHWQSPVSAWVDVYGDSFLVMLFTWGT